MYKYLSVDPALEASLSLALSSITASRFVSSLMKLANSMATPGRIMKLGCKALVSTADAQKGRETQMHAGQCSGVALSNMHPTQTHGRFQKRPSWEDRATRLVRKAPKVSLAESRSTGRCTGDPSLALFST